MAASHFVAFASRMLVGQSKFREAALARCIPRRHDQFTEDDKPRLRREGGLPTACNPRERGTTGWSHCLAGEVPDARSRGSARRSPNRCAGCARQAPLFAVAEDGDPRPCRLPTERQRRVRVDGSALPHLSPNTTTRPPSAPWRCLGPAIMVYKNVWPIVSMSPTNAAGGSDDKRFVPSREFRRSCRTTSAVALQSDRMDILPWATSCL